MNTGDLDDTSDTMAPSPSKTNPTVRSRDPETPASFGLYIDLYLSKKNDNNNHAVTGETPLNSGLRYSGVVDARTSPANQFHLFPHLPYDMRLSVARSAFNKPAIHFVNIKRCLEEQFAEKYLVTMTPVEKALDSSMFRVTDGMLTTFAGTGIRREHLFLAPLSLSRGSRVLPAWIDAATDIVCVSDMLDSADLRTKWLWHVLTRRTTISHPDASFVAGPSFHRGFESPAQDLLTMDRQALTMRLRGLRRVGVMGHINASGVLRCRAPHGPHSVLLRPYQFACSVELAAFFDCFPDLEVAYVFLPRDDLALHSHWSNYARDYFTEYLSKTAAQRNVFGLELFQDASQHYIEFTEKFHVARELSPSNQGPFDHPLRSLVDTMEETRKVFTEQDNDLAAQHGANSAGHTLSLERRQAVDFKVMMGCGFLA